MMIKEWTVSWYQVYLILFTGPHEYVNPNLDGFWMDYLKNLPSI